MQIQVIDQLQADPQRLRAMFVVRALRALDRMAPGILKLVGKFRDLNGPKGGVDHACSIEVALRDGTHFRAEARSAQLLEALDGALARLVRRIDAANKRQLSKRRSGLLALDAG
ncbi:MAG: HPF/RaiA family ribosome-associated protein [Lysobacterales bacterium]